MRIGVTGGRFYDKEDTVRYVLSLVNARVDVVAPNTIPTLINGGSSGADFLARLVAERLGWHIETHYADWDTHGKEAGPIRNQHMVDSRLDLLIVFPGGRGTADMKQRAEKANIHIYEVAPEKSQQ